MTDPRLPAESNTRRPDDPTRIYRALSLGGAIVFAIVGILFLIIPESVLRFFSDISSSLGMEPTPAESGVLYHVLAVGYMYLVTLLAWLMFRQPENRLLPLLLMNAKGASSILSFVFFFAISHTLIYLTNGVVDGMIAAGIVLLMRRQRRMP